MIVVYEELILNDVDPVYVVSLNVTKTVYFFFIIHDTFD